MNIDKLLNILFIAWQKQEHELPILASDWESSIMQTILKQSDEKVVFINSFIPKLIWACSVLLVAFSLYSSPDFYSNIDSVLDRELAYSLDLDDYQLTLT